MMLTFAEVFRNRMLLVLSQERVSKYLVLSVDSYFFICFLFFNLVMTFFLGGGVFVCVCGGGGGVK